MAARWGNAHSKGHHLEQIVLIKVLCDIDLFHVEGLRNSN